MTIAENIWLRSQAAQTNLLHIASYNTAFIGTATLQVWHMSLTAPTSFWSAMARVGDDTDETLEPAIAEPAEVAASLPASKGANRSAPKAVDSATKSAKATNARSAIAKTETSLTPVLLDEPRGGKADDLKGLNGIGPKLETALNELGIYHFDQIAGLNDQGLAWLNARQKGFSMTAERFDLIAQAKAKLPN